MKLSVTVNGHEHILEINGDGAVSCRLDGTAFEADVSMLESGVYSLLIGGRSFTVRVSPTAEISPAVNGGSAAEYDVQTGGKHYSVAVRDPRRTIHRGRAKASIEGRQTIAARMPGKVIRLLVSEGESVESGQGLIVVEAMKMQNEIKCPKSAKIQKILVHEGQPVNAGDVLLLVE